MLSFLVTRPGFPPVRGGSAQGYAGYSNQFAMSPTGGYPPAGQRGGFAKYPSPGPGRGNMIGSMGPVGMGMNAGYGSISGGNVRAARADGMQIGLGGGLGGRGGAPPGMVNSMNTMPGMNSGFASGLGSYGMNSGMGYNMGSAQGFSSGGSGLGGGSGGSFGGSMNGYGQLQPNHMQTGSLGSGISPQQDKVGAGMNSATFGPLSGHSPTSGYGGFSPTGQSGVPGMQAATPSSGFVSVEGDIEARTLSLNAGGGSGVSAAAAAGLSYDGSATFSEGPAPGWSS